jgi:sec-independent protein translocase protein TatB
MGNEFRAEINKVAALDDVKDIKKSITAPLTDTKADIEREFNKITPDGFEPSGKIAPADPNAQSVYDEIKSAIGDKDTANSSATAPQSKKKVAKKAPAAKRKPAVKAKSASRATKTAKTAAKSKVAAKRPATKAKAASATRTTAAKKASNSAPGKRNR